MSPKNLNMIFNIHVLQAPAESKWLLYAIFLFSLLYVADLAMHGDYRVVSVFILVAFISSFFTKNMIFILGLALFSSWMLSDEIKSQIRGTTTSLEGFDDATDLLEDLMKEDEDEEIPSGSTSGTLFKGGEPSGKEKTSSKDDDSSINNDNKHIKKKSKKEKMTNYDENDLDAIKEQTKQLLDTHNELLKNVEKLRPYLREAGDFTKTLSKFMEKSEPAKVE